MRFRRWPLFHGRRIVACAAPRENWTKASAKKGRIQTQRQYSLHEKLTAAAAAAKRPRDRERENKTSRVSCAARTMDKEKTWMHPSRNVCVYANCKYASLSLSFSLCVCLRRCCCANTWPEQHTRRVAVAQNWAAWERKGEQAPHSAANYELLAVVKEAKSGVVARIFN